MQALRELQDLSAHEQPNRDPGPLIAKAIRLALAEKRRAVRKERKRKQKPCATGDASTGRPDRRPSEASTSSPAKGRASRRAPAAVVREVWSRDEGRCTYVSPHGRRCAETACLELDHAVPWAKGGASTVTNLRLRCRTHNQLAAEQSFGRGFVDARREGRCRESVVAYRPAPKSDRPRGRRTSLFDGSEVADTKLALLTSESASLAPHSAHGARRHPGERRASDAAVARFGHSSRRSPSRSALAPCLRAPARGQPPLGRPSVFA